MTAAAATLRSPLVDKTYADVLAARSRLDGQVLRTTLKASQSLSTISGVPVYLKLENSQTTGSFKLRGATNAILLLDPQKRQRGVVTASTGNHGRALAYAAKAHGARAIVCMSELVPANKVEAVRALGADVRIVGRSQDDAQGEVDRLVRTEGLTAVPPFDDPAVIAGQGTVGLEIVEELPDIDLVVVPLSGGGLAAGLAVAVKARRPQARIIGVSMAGGPAMHDSIAAGHPVLVEEVQSLADSLGGGIGLANQLTFELCRELLDGTVLVSECEITEGVRHAFHFENEVVEGAGAVAIAALTAHKVRVAGPTVLILSGRNIDRGLHRKIVGSHKPAQSVWQGI